MLVALDASATAQANLMNAWDSGTTQQRAELFNRANDELREKDKGSKPVNKAFLGSGQKMRRPGTPLERPVVPPKPHFPLPGTGKG